MNPNRYVYVGGGVAGLAAIIAAWIAIGVGGGGSNNGGFSKCPPPKFPDLTCVGVPPGVTLTPYTGPNPITTDNTVIDGKLFSGYIEVRASNVTIRNSKIVGTTGSDGQVVNLDSVSYGKQPLRLEDTEIYCGGLGGSGIVEANFIIRRVWVHGCENGLSVDQNVDMRDSYIGPMLDEGGTEAHEDGSQWGCGHWDPTFTGSSCGAGYAPGALNITYIHNTIFGTNADGTFTTSAIITPPMANHEGVPEGARNILIQDNLLAGGGYTLYCTEGGTGGSFRVINNHFSQRFKVPRPGFPDGFGQFGPSSGDCYDEIQSGNVNHETGAPMTLQ